MDSSNNDVAVLALASGEVFVGQPFGARRGLTEPVIGEVVFNTSMYGYQEILTDPSYAGQLVTFTYPHIGNVGCNPDDDESSRVFAEGAICREVCDQPSSYRSREDLGSYMQRAGKMGISGIDTRALVRHIRDHGAQMAALACCAPSDAANLIQRARGEHGMLGRDYVHAVSTQNAYSWSEGGWSLQDNTYRVLSEEKLATRPHVVAIDCGIKRAILRLLVDAGFRVSVVPATMTADEIAAYRPDGVFLSNGPGDPATLKGLVGTVRSILGRYPIFGICLGHQILALASGGETFKLKFGHRGGNHPVLDMTTGAIEITVQNHGFAVRREGLPASVEITHVNLNDQTVEGLQVPGKRAFSVQYHPEASPGPHDSCPLFKRFYTMVVGAA